MMSSGGVAATAAWQIYTLTRDAAGTSTLYKFGTAIVTRTNQPGFATPLLGGWTPNDQCSNADVGAFSVYNYAMTSTQVNAAVQELSILYGLPSLKFLEFKSSASAATCTGSQSISLWPNNAKTGFSLTAFAGDISPSLYWDSASGRCVARFSSACSRGYSSNVNLWNTASTIMVLARVSSSNARVLSDKNLNWLLGWWSTLEDTWYDGSGTTGFLAMGPTTTLNTWQMYTLTRDAAGTSTLYKFGSAIATSVNQPGFATPLLGGYFQGECANADVGAFAVYNYAMTSTQVNAAVQELSTLYALPPPSGSATPSNTPTGSRSPSRVPTPTTSPASSGTGMYTSTPVATSSPASTPSPSTTSAPVVPGSLLYLPASSLATTPADCTGSIASWSLLPRASAIRVINGPHSDACANLGEVLAYDAAGKNWALSANGGNATASSIGYKMTANQSNDGDYNTMWHSSCVEAAWIQVTFAQPVVITAVSVFARQDCCQLRDVNDVVQLLDESGNVYWSTTINAFADAAPYMWQSSLPALAPTPVPTASPPRAFAIRVNKNPQGDCSNLGEVAVMDAAGKNWALSANGGTATSSGFDFNCPPNQAIDGDIYSIWHSACSFTVPPAAAWIQIAFAQPVIVSSINVFPRQDPAALFRDVNDVVQLLDASGNVIWSTTIVAFPVAAPYMWQSSFVAPAPTKFWDAASGQCVARFASTCSLLTAKGVPSLYNSSSTVSVIARIKPGGVSRRVLSDSSSNFALGWSNGNENVWLDAYNNSGVASSPGTWIMYTLTRDAAGNSIVYRNSTAIFTSSSSSGQNQPGFRSLQLGGVTGECSDVDVGALLIYNFTLTPAQVYQNAVVLSQTFMLGMPTPSPTASPASTPARTTSPTVTATSTPPPLGTNALLYLRSSDLGTSSSCTRSRGIHYWPNAATASLYNLNPSSYMMSPLAGDAHPTMVWDASSQQCVARFSSVCTRYTSTNFTALYNSSYTIIVMARVIGVSQRVLSDSSTNDDVAWLMGWYDNGQDQVSGRNKVLALWGGVFAPCRVVFRIAHLSPLSPVPLLPHSGTTRLAELDGWTRANPPGPTRGRLTRCPPTPGLVFPLFTGTARCCSRPRCGSLGLNTRCWEGTAGASAPTRMWVLC